MKRVSSLIKLFNKQLLCTLTCFATAGNTFAQPIIPPTGPDNIMSTSMEPINSAELCYGAIPNQVVFAITQQGTGIYVQDAGTGVAVIVAPVHGGNPADVIIGNDVASPPNFIMATATYDLTSRVWIDFYEITGMGTAAFAVTPVASTFIAVATGGYAANTTHIDVIWDRVLSVCNKFVVTYDDPGNHNVYVAYGDLTALTVSGAVAISTSGTASMPDVAGVQRLVGPPVDDLALITYVDAGALMYAEYDFTATVPGIIAGPSIVDNTAPITIPRIDAIDDYTVNVIPGMAYYKIAAEYGTSAIRTYDNLPGGWTGWNSAFGLPGMGNYSPVVAVSGSNDYSVYHWTQVGMGMLAPLCANFVDPVAMGGSLLAPNCYFWVNSNFGSLVYSNALAMPDTWGITVSGPANQQLNGSVRSLYAWVERDPATLAMATKYKLATTSPFLFKPGRTTTEVQEVPAAKWHIFPNPATNVLNIAVDGKVADGVKYVVYDLSGIAVTSGDVCEKTTVDIGKLAPASYIIKMTDGKNSFQYTFVKE
jgi:hypothetical protein